MTLGFSHEELGVPFLGSPLPCTRYADGRNVGPKLLETSISEASTCELSSAPWLLQPKGRQLLVIFLGRYGRWNAGAYVTRAGFWGRSQYSYYKDSTVILSVISASVFYDFKLWESLLRRGSHGIEIANAKDRVQCCRA